MKVIFKMVLPLALVFGSLGLNANQNFSSSDNRTEISLENLEFQNEIMEEKVYTCYGQASCGGFRSVTCQSYGDGCSWQVVQRPIYNYGRIVGYQGGVQCSGYNRSGRWVSSYAWCNY